MDAKKAAITTAYVVFFLWLLTPIVLLIFFPAIGERGQFGDGYGFITSLFSGITIIGLIYTIYLQREEIKTTKESFEHQKFDDTFFKMLNIHTTYSNGLPQTYFLDANQNIKMRLDELSDSEFDNNKRKTLISSFMSEHNRYVLSFGTLANWVCMKRNKKYRSEYLKILISYISLDERVFLLNYCCLTSVKPKSLFIYKDSLFSGVSNRNLSLTTQQKWAELIDQSELNPFDRVD